MRCVLGGNCAVVSQGDRFADGGYVVMFIFFFGFNVSPCCEALASHKGRDGAISDGTMLRLFVFSLT